MTLLIAVLRLLHIVAAFVWFGLGTVMTLYIVPAAQAADDNGSHYLKSLFTNTRIAMAFPVAAGLTTLAGILLYLTGDVGNNFSNTGRIVLAIGALSGLAAAIHGGAVSQRSTRALVSTLTQHVTRNQPITAEGLTALRTVLTKISTDTQISFVLMVIALIGMGSARYL